MSERIIEGTLLFSKNNGDGCLTVKVAFSDAAVPQEFRVSHFAAFCYASQQSRGIAKLEENSNKGLKIKLALADTKVTKLRIETDPDYNEPAEKWFPRKVLFSLPEPLYRQNRPC